MLNSTYKSILHLCLGKGGVADSYFGMKNDADILPEGEIEGVMREEASKYEGNRERKVRTPFISPPRLQSDIDAALIPSAPPV